MEIKSLFRWQTEIVERKHYCVLLFTLLLFCCLCSSCNFSSAKRHNRIDKTSTSSTFSTANSLFDVGYPMISDTITSTMLERMCYTVSYNKFTRQPNWVMWQLTGEHVIPKKEGVWNEYREDSELPSEIRSTLDDYASSGYDRGHMCPGGDCNWDDEGRDETFLLSNMCPQNPNLNRGDWKEIEIACRKWAKQYDNIYIVCGPIFFKSQEHEKIGAHQIPVPEAFFKVILCVEPSNPKGIGFICRNTDGNRKKDFYVNSIRQVERVTGYRFFSNLDDSIKSVVYDMDDINEW